MKVVIFGASGMIGQGVLLECLRDTGVDRVLVVGRSSVGRQDAKLREVLVADLFDVASYVGELTDLDACFFCLGVSSAGMSEAAYRHLTYDLTVSIAQELAARNSGLCFVYVSGAGTDSTERGRTMWARVKGATENALLRMPFRSAFMFRPGVIQPLDGIRSKTRAYRIAYVLTAPIMPLLRRAFPNSVLTTREIGQAMLAVARRGWPRPVLEAKDIHRAAMRTT
ncbi:MAG TPA: epimerase [Acidobacteriaceae bacterium]|nr:epimerase [Acidobacteriaceae bacterium]